MKRHDIINGCMAFIESEVVNCISDKSIKILVGTLVPFMANKPELIDKYVFDNPLISCMLQADENGEYDVGPMLDSLKESIVKYGSIQITIPSIPLLSKEEKQLSFSSVDIDKLKSYIERSCGVNAIS